MRRNSFLTFLKEKSFIIVLTLILVSAGTMAALFAFGGDDQTEENNVAEQTEQQFESQLDEVAEAEEAVQEALDETASVVQKTMILKNTTDTNEKEMETASIGAELEDQYLEVEEMAEASATDVIAEGFSESALLSLQWPVEGDVILPFSMDQSVYFKTLAQYQYNPAMLISAAEGTEVYAAASGTVTEVGKTNEYGHYVTMDLGDGFSLTYGQLFDVTTEVGETLDAGERFAMVAYPSGNYLEEGDNLYLKLTRNGVPVNPELYLEK